MVTDSNVSSDVIIGSGQTRTVADDETIIGLTVQSGGSVTNSGTVSNVTDQGQIENYSAMQSAVVQSGADVDFVGGTGSSITIDAGGSVVAGQSAHITSITMTAGGSLTVQSGAAATGITISGDVENTLVVGSNGYVSGVNVSGAADNSAQGSAGGEVHDVIVNSGGVADDVTVYHDHLVVNGGGLASGVTLNDAGITVQSNGVVSAMTVNAQGVYAAYINGGVSYESPFGNSRMSVSA
ncbi:hypothetical protein [Acetobacter ascendens]|uniref:hypothetical protein n=1 Tax=Acetobacter ascendens TaxID=481146 RepID=UPI000875E276|nr:hypothetical protein [Acetobacter ascendens]AOW49334.1 hypothetical protein A4R89_07795 [Acetobacter ascendens]